MHIIIIVIITIIIIIILDIIIICRDQQRAEIMAPEGTRGPKEWAKEQGL